MITFVIFTYNEEERIDRVIRNFKNYGKILLADNNSTDRTWAIAKEHGCNIYLRTKEYVFVENQELVDELYKVIDTEWIYWGFADEMLDKESLEQLKSITSSNQFDLISMDRKNYFYGRFCYNLYHARTFKLFKKHALDFTDNQIHSMGKPTVPSERICNLPDRYFIHHFISNTASSYLNVINRYTESEREVSGVYETSFFKFIFMIAKIVLKDFFDSKGYRTGFSNIALSQLMLTYAFVKKMKLYECSKEINTEMIENLNNTEREKILLNL